MHCKRFIRAGKVLEGWEPGGNSLPRRKERWRMVPQPSFSPAGQALAGASPKCYNSLTEGLAPRPSLHTCPAPPSPEAARLHCLACRRRLSQLSWPCHSPTTEVSVGATSKHSFLLVETQPCVKLPCTPTPTTPPAQKFCDDCWTNYDHCRSTTMWLTKGLPW